MTLRSLTPAERAAIDAYTGPVTICPPRKHTEGLEWIGDKARVETHRSLRRSQDLSAARGRSTRNLVMKRYNEGMDVKDIARLVGLSEGHVRRLVQDETP